MKVGIIGLGLIGSSLALKIGEAYNDITIYGEDISESNLKYTICLLYTSPSPRD